MHCPIISVLAAQPTAAVASTPVKPSPIVSIQTDCRDIDRFAFALARHGDDPRLQAVWKQHVESILGLDSNKSFFLLQYASRALATEKANFAASQQPRSGLFNEQSGFVSSVITNDNIVAPALKPQVPGGPA